MNMVLGRAEVSFGVSLAWTAGRPVRGGPICWTRVPVRDWPTPTVNAARTA
jgi:hypothetical protein